MVAAPEPHTGPISDDGHAVDPDPYSPGGDPVFDDLEDYVASPATTSVPVAYDALRVADFIDFRASFDPGDLSNGITLAVRLPEDMARLADRLVHREDIPYATKSDLLREALFTFMKALIDRLRIHDPELISLMAETKTRAQARFAVDRHDAWKEMRENLEIQLLFWLDRGEVQECGRSIQAFWDEGRKIPHTAWRAHVCAILRDHPLVRASALAALAGGFLFSSDLRTFAGDWK